MPALSQAMSGLYGPERAPSGSVQFHHFGAPTWVNSQATKNDKAMVVKAHLLTVYGLH
jgi:hypothetical protein